MGENIERQLQFSQIKLKESWKRERGKSQKCKLDWRSGLVWNKTLRSFYWQNKSRQVFFLIKKTKKQLTYITQNPAGGSLRIFNFPRPPANQRSLHFYTVSKLKELKNEMLCVMWPLLSNWVG